MSAFRWIQMVSLFLTHIHLTAVTGQSGRFFNTKLSSLVVREGDEATFLCSEAKDECDASTWDVYNDGLVLDQHIKNSDRMSVTQNCSLVIKNVTVQDFGLYTCLTRFQLDVQTYMSVITLTEEEEGGRMTLHCSMMTENVNKYRLRWLYEGERADGRNGDLENISQTRLSVSVTFLTSNRKLRSNYQELFTCEVTDVYAGSVQEFMFRRRSSGEDVTTTSTAPPTGGGEKQTRTDCSLLDYVMLAMRVAELLLITVITVLLIRAGGKQRSPDDNAVHRDRGRRDGTLNYENI